MEKLVTMYFKVIWCFVACVAIVNAKRELIPLPQEVLPILGEKSIDCIAKTGINQELLPKLLAGQIEDSPQIRKFIYCFATSTDYAEKTGHFKVDKMVKLVGDHKNREAYKNVIEECNKNKAKNNEETMFKTVVCFTQKSPIMFTM